VNRYSTSPWLAIIAAVVSVLVADWLTGSLIGSLLIAVAVGLIFAGIRAVLLRRSPRGDNRNVDTREPR
jgi:ABC-type uncharacterized transport system permease subunit